MRTPRITVSIGRIVTDDLTLDRAALARAIAAEIRTLGPDALGPSRAVPALSQTLGQQGGTAALARAAVRSLAR